MTDGARFLKKELVAQIWVKWTKIGPKTRFFVIFSSLVHVVFLEIAYSDSLQQCLTFSRDKIQEKKIFGPKFGSKGPKSVLKLGLFPFSQAGSLIFLEIACNDSLQQCQTRSRGKIHGKNFGTQIWAKGAKISPETKLFAIFLSLVHGFFLKLHMMIACNNI